MAVTYAQTPADQFRDLVPTFRNVHIIAALQPLVLLHQQLHSNGGLADRSGSDTTLRNLVLMHTHQADRIRRRITFNPENEKLAALTIPEVDAALKAELAKAAETDKVIDGGAQPFGGDTVAAATTQLIDVPWQFSGGDASGTVRLNSELESRFKSGPGYLVFGAVNESIVAWTNLESRFRSKFITKYDSLRMLGHYQAIVEFAFQFMGESNRLDVPEGVLANERPSGPLSAPNVTGETSGNRPKA